MTLKKKKTHTAQWTRKDKPMMQWKTEGHDCEAPNKTFSVKYSWTCTMHCMEEVFGAVVVEALVPPQSRKRQLYCWPADGKTITRKKVARRKEDASRQNYDFEERRRLRRFKDPNTWLPLADLFYRALRFRSTVNFLMKARMAADTLWPHKRSKKNLITKKFLIGCG